MGDKITAFLSAVFRSRYVTYLEQELERERTINMQLTNSLLANAGMPQINQGPRKPQAPIQGRLTPSQARRANEMQDHKAFAEVKQ